LSKVRTSGATHIPVGFQTDQ